MFKKLLFLKDKKLFISKYLLYYIFLAALLFPVYKKIWFAVTYKKTAGRITGFITSTAGSGNRTVYFTPQVGFSVGEDSFECYGSPLQKESVSLNDHLPVIYDPDNPEDCFVYTPLAFWMPKLTYILPGFLVLTLCLGIGSIPDYFTIRFK